MQTTTFCCQFLHAIKWFGSLLLVSDLVPANVIVKNKNSGTVNTILLKYLQKPPHIILQGDCRRCLFPFGCVSGWWVYIICQFPVKMKAFARNLGVLNFETFPVCTSMAPWVLDQTPINIINTNSDASLVCIVLLRFEGLQRGEWFKGPGNTLRTAWFKVMQHAFYHILPRSSLSTKVLPLSPQHLDCCNGFLSFSCSGFLRAPCRLQCIFQCLLGGLDSAWMLNHGFWVRRDVWTRMPMGLCFLMGPQQVEV